MSSAPEQSTAAKSSGNPKIKSSLLRYRVLAYATGIWLLLLTAEVVAKYGLRSDAFPAWIPVVHGWVYIVYLLVTIDLAVKVRWPVPRTVGTLLAGTIPFLSFFVEHWRSSQVKRDFKV